LCLAVLIGLLATTLAQAARYSSVTSTGKEVVAHTRLAPVVVHRILPPYGLGKHVYEPRANATRETVVRPTETQAAPVQ
jgi:hypothetical protein